MVNNSTDIVIIGAGPIGLFQIFQAGMLKMKCHVFDSLDFIGGQCQALYPEKPIYDIPAWPEIKSSELVAKLKQQAEQFSPVFHLKEQVTKIIKDKVGYLVSTNLGTSVYCKAIVIAAGCGAFGPNRPPLENIEEYEKSGKVKYLINRIAEFTDKKVVIAGGGDSALDWVIALSEVAKEVSIVHRRSKFRAAPHSVEKLHELANSGKINLITPYQLAGLEGGDGKLEKVVLKDMSGNIKKVEADYLLPFYGLSMQLGPIADWGLDLERKHVLVDPATMETNVSGIYAVGDITTYKNKLKLISVGFSEAAFAAHHFYHKVFPDQVLHFEYSTTKGVA
jgi:thioredoxin reductase (NADPH)